MWFLEYYRFYLTIILVIILWLFLKITIFFAIAIGLFFRIIWLIVERLIERIKIERFFKKHIYSFKQELGPYGIRIANQAEKNFSIKKSLSEVFVNNPKQLKKNVEQLEIMDTLFKAGISPQGDAYLLHDCKLKYGKIRLAQIEKKINKKSI